MLPTPTRHLQIQYQQIADASNPRTGICKFISSKLQILPTPTRHLQIQFQQIADTSTSGIHPYMYLQVQYQQIADTSEPRIGIYKSNSSKLQILPIPTRHLQVQYQQVVDTSDPDQASANPNPANCRCFRTRPGICKFISSKLWMLPNLTRHLQIQIQQVVDASNPNQASANPIPTSCRCFRTRPGIYNSNTSKLQMLPTPTRHLQIQFQQIADASNPRICICKFNTSKLQMLPNPG